MNTRLMATVCAAVIGVAIGIEAAPKKKAKDAPVGPPPQAALYDTVEAGKLGDAVSSMGGGAWKKIEEGQTPASFQGDAALVNNRVAAVVRKDGSGVDLFARGEQGWARRGRLAPVVGGKEAKLGAAKVVSSDAAEAAVQAPVQGADGLAMSFSLPAGFPVVKATKGGKVEALRFIAPCRLAVLPDFFADDLMIDARDIKVDRTEIPSDNFFLHMVGEGSCILGAVWEKNERDVEVTIAGEGENRVLASTDVFFGSQTNVWAAILEHESIWHSTNVTRVTKEVSMKSEKIEGWTAPFLAKWKANFTRADGLVESSGFNYRVHGHYAVVKGNKCSLGTRGAPRGRWAGSINGISDLSYAHVFKEYIGLDGVMVVYPITRAPETPPDKWCTDDLLRHCLGQEACGYVLDAGARDTSNKGIFTCSYAGTFGKCLPGDRTVFRNRTITAALKEERFYYKHVTDQVLVFVKHIEDRINVYVDFTMEMLGYLDKQEEAHPEHAEFIGKLRKELERPTRVFGRHKKRDVRANGLERGLVLIKPLYKALRVDTPENGAQGPSAGRMKGIGDPQDSRVAGLRQQVKLVRSMATLEMARNPAVAGIAKEIRKKSEAVLRNPAGYEGVGTIW